MSFLKKAFKKLKKVTKVAAPFASVIPGGALAKGAISKARTLKNKVNSVKSRGRLASQAARAMRNRPKGASELLPGVPRPVSYDEDASDADVNESFSNPLDPADTSNDDIQDGGDQDFDNEGNGASVDEQRYAEYT